MPSKSTIRYRTNPRYRKARLEYAKKWRLLNQEKAKARDKKYYTANRDKRLEYTKTWRLNNLEYKKRYRRAESSRLRISAVDIIGRGKAICVNCGMDRVEILEINHKNGGGSQERKNKSTTEFYRKIVNGKRSIDDLELLCKVCNIIHFVKHKFDIDWLASVNIIGEYRINYRQL